MKRKESVNPSGLIVVKYELTEAQRKERREDNKIMKQSRELHRRRKRHGRSR